MAKKSKVASLAQKLQCDPGEAKEFGDSVNRLLTQLGHKPISFLEIEEIVSMITQPFSPKMVVDNFIMGPPSPQRTAGTATLYTNVRQECQDERALKGDRVSIAVPDSDTSVTQSKMKTNATRRQSDIAYRKIDTAWKGSPKKTDPNQPTQDVFEQVRVLFFNNTSGMAVILLDSEKVLCSDAITKEYFYSEISTRFHDQHWYTYEYSGYDSAIYAHRRSGLVVIQNACGQRFEDMQVRLAVHIADKPECLVVIKPEWEALNRSLDGFGRGPSGGSALTDVIPETSQQALGIRRVFFADANTGLAVVAVRTIMKGTYYVAWKPQMKYVVITPIDRTGTNTDDSWWDSSAEPF